MQQKLNFVDFLHNLEKKPDIDGVILESNSGNTKHNESFMSRAVMCGQSKQYNTILKNKWEKYDTVKKEHSLSPFIFSTYMANSDVFTHSRM